MDDRYDDDGEDSDSQGGTVDPEDVPDDAPVIDLTHEYELDWMARGRRESEYKDALEEYLQGEHGYTADETESLWNGGPFRSLSLLEEEWDEVWQREEDPGEAMVNYLGEETIAAVIDEDFETKQRKRLRQKMAYRPHMQELYNDLYGDGDE